MINIGILGSGSSGNSVILENEKFSFVIDCGFSFKKFCKRAATLGFDIQRIKYVLLSHDHIDHVYGISRLIAQLSVPLVCHNNLNRTFLKKNIELQKILFKHNKIFNLYNNKLQIYPFLTLHDASFSSGFFVKFAGRKILYLTDTGMVTDEMVKLAQKSSIIFLEANYEPDLLDNGPYPRFLKNRIRSKNGHLSNQDAIHFLDKILNSNIINSNYAKDIYLCHLSGTNNSKKIIKEKILAYFSDYDSRRIKTNPEFLEISKNKLTLKIFIISEDKPYRFEISD